MVILLVQSHSSRQGTAAKKLGAHAA